MNETTPHRHRRRERGEECKKCQSSFRVTGGRKERGKEGGREENGSSFPMMILVYNRRAGSGVAVHTASCLNVSVFG